MFQYIYPRFQSGRILRTGMLEQLRDYPKDYLELMYSGYGNGIITGCGISWEMGKLSVEPGMICYGGRPYVMKRRQTLDCKAEDKRRYLVAAFLEDVEEPGQSVGRGRLVLSEVVPDPSCELEICRFGLQEGARLRTHYENFADYATEYDTVNVIHTPYAAEGESTLHPGLLIRYAEELLEKGPENPYDINFSMNILAGNGRLAMRCVKRYLKARGVEVKNSSNKGVYDGLLHVLKQQSGRTEDCGEGRRKGRGVMLV